MSGHAATRRLAWTCGVGVVALALGACANISKEEYDAALQENVELRERLAVMDSTIREYDTRNAELTAENAALAEELEKVRAGSGSINWGTGVGVRAGDGELILDIAGDVLFDSGSATLKSSAKRSLDQIASQIKANFPGNMIRVEGYTDTDPIRKSKWETNRRLSSERAMAVEEYLISRGLSDDMVYSAGFGTARQKANKSSSRRVEIVILSSAE